MKSVRTTLKLESGLKKAAERKALEMDTTLQAIFNEALRNFIQEQAKIKARNIVFIEKAVDKKLDNLTRDHYYGD